MSKAAEIIASSLSLSKTNGFGRRLLSIAGCQLATLFHSYNSIAQSRRKSGEGIRHHLEHAYRVYYKGKGDSRRGTKLSGGIANSFPKWKDISFFWQ